MSDDSQQNSKSGAAHSPSIKRKLRKTILFMAIGGTLLLGLIFGFLQSGFGKNLLAGFINSHLKPSGLQISGIQGFLPFEFRLAGLQCSDSEGTWLEAENLEVHCTWFSRELDLDIKRFTCSKVTILRMPENTDGSKETKPLWPLPLQDYALRARSIQIQEIHVSPDIVDSLGIEELDPEGDGTVLSVDGRM
ncbi:MAG: hypothetical protein QGG53_19400, partial [Planctomycetota bacterium]|nr:hypothetical protein [Planctomycetota bacterium]